MDDDGWVSQRYEAVQSPDDTSMVFDVEAGVPVVEGEALLGGFTAREADVVMDELSRGRRIFLSERFALTRMG